MRAPPRGLRRGQRHRRRGRRVRSPHLGLAHCRVASLPTPEIAAETALVSLDLAHNALESLPDALEALATTRPRTLRLAGNPIALVPGYRALVLAALPRLRHLDGVSATDDDGRADYRGTAAPAPPRPTQTPTRRKKKPRARAG